MKKTRKVPPAIRRMSDDCIAYANAHPEIQSLLYNLDLMPEQLEEFSPRWGQMISVIAHMKALRDSAPTKNA